MASHLSTSMNTLQHQSLRFEELAAMALATGGYRIDREIRFRIDGKTLAIDAVAQLGSQDFLVEFKWTRLDPVPLRMLRDWASRFSIYKTLDPEAVFLLVVSGGVDEAHKVWIKQQFDVQVLDMEGLAALARDDDSLLRQLSEFRHATARLETERLASRGPAPIVEGSPLGPAETIEPSAHEASGQALIDKLEATPAGKKGAKAYENICIEIVAYLFGEYLLDARPQSRTEDGLNIMDVVYRVKQQHNFWQTLTRDFKSRVVVFEFKNYSERIGPKQIYTTERYLSASAMRSVCFLVSRHAPHLNAELTAFGALRESGKLLVFLDDGDLKTMLRFRDAELVALRTGRTVEDDASVVLDQKIYQFLATMGR
jgi:hypothetical protein